MATKASVKPGSTSGTTGKPQEVAKAQYIVGTCPVLHDHEVYQSGDTLELSESEAQHLKGKVLPATDATER